MKAKKSFGQHFLARPETARRIANSFDLSDVDQMLEVGPGQGMLTQFLLEREKPLKAVEADKDMVEYLSRQFPEWASDNVISEDFLKIDLQTVLKRKPTALVGNFPYNISSQILIRLVENRDVFPKMVGMFQRELAERVLAPEGSKVYGAISVLVQAYYTGAVVMHLKPGSFNPPPKVDSTVIALTRKPNYEQLGCSERHFRKLVKVSFQQRRKMLRKSLKSIWPVDISLENEKMKRRPEQLSVQEFVLLTQEYEKALEIAS